MPIALLLIGTIFLIAAVRGKAQVDELLATLKDDFTGPNNFIFWALSLWVIMAVGYVKPLKPLSNAFLVLVIIVLFLKNKTFFGSFMEQIQATTATPKMAADVTVFDGVGNLVSGPPLDTSWESTSGNTLVNVGATGWNGPSFNNMTF